MEKVRRENELIERLKNTRMLSDIVGENLSSIIKQQRLPVNKRMLNGLMSSTQATTPPYITSTFNRYDSKSPLVQEKVGSHKQETP